MPLSLMADVVALITSRPSGDQVAGVSGSVAGGPVRVIEQCLHDRSGRYSVVPQNVDGAVAGRRPVRVPAGQHRHFTRPDDASERALSPGRHCAGRTARIACQIAICFASGNRPPLRVLRRRREGAIDSARLRPTAKRRRSARWLRSSPVSVASPPRCITSRSAARRRAMRHAGMTSKREWDIPAVISIPDALRHPEPYRREVPR